jgi:flavin-dependent dehydrogenase
MNQYDTYDVIIVGGGPAGLQAAIHASRRKASVLVLGKESKHIYKRILIFGRFTNGSATYRLPLVMPNLFARWCRLLRCIPRSRAAAARLPL